jgi:hypothetical protein
VSVAWPIAMGLVLVMSDDDGRIGTTLARAWLALGLTWVLATQATTLLS